jgi:hypothetical protein
MLRDAAGYSIEPPHSCEQCFWDIVTPSIMWHALLLFNRDITYERSRKITAKDGGRTVIYTHTHTHRYKICNTDIYNTYIHVHTHTFTRRRNVWKIWHLLGGSTNLPLRERGGSCNRIIIMFTKSKNWHYPLPLQSISPLYILIQPRPILLLYLHVATFRFV